MKFLLAIAAPVACLTLGCAGAGDDGGSPTGAAEQPWMSGAGPTRGHEDLLRFGVEKANAALEADGGPKKLWPEVTKGEACVGTSNELLAGNCATDWPTDEMTAYYGVSSSSFGDDPGLQDLHALRNLDSASNPVSGRYGCYLIRGRILNATQRGLTFWKNADQASGTRWIGHATHTVQDSFTPCHTTRSGTRFETLQDICTYAVSFPGICTHHKPDTADTAWRLSPLECAINLDRSWDCLVETAQAGSLATAGYLVAVGRLIEASNFDGAQAAIETWFEGDPTIAESGYFRCDALKADGVEPDAWSPPGVDGGDAAPDSPMEAAADAPAEAALDAPTEAASEAEAPKDAGQEAAADASPHDAGKSESGAEAAADAPKDAHEAGADSAPQPAEPAPSSDGGCSCRTARAPHGSLLVWLAAGAVVAGLRIRRRRARHGH